MLYNEADHGKSTATLHGAITIHYSPAERNWRFTIVGTFTMSASKSMDWLQYGEPRFDVPTS